MKKYFTLNTVLALILLGMTGCGKEKWTPPSESELLLGTFVSITCYDSTLARRTVHQAMDSAFTFIRLLEKHANPFDSTSEVARINSHTREQRIFPLSPVLSPLLDKALQLSRLTSGAYDPTLWPVFRLWHFGTDSAAIPQKDSLDKNLVLVDYRKVAMEGSRLIFKETGMGIDLSGISKGYAVEKCREILKSFGLRNFIIDAGGNLGIEWHSCQPVNVLIRHPRQSGAFFGKFTVRKSCGVATSGDYQNYFTVDSVIYHHILDPATGYPARDVVSVTVMAPDAVMADGLSTALFVMGRKKGLEFAEKAPGVEALFIYVGENGALMPLLSRGLKTAVLSAPSPNHGRK